jgi:uncharacterized protein YndB with AHSA1/START domain
MPQTLTATKSINIAATPQRVWEALTDPAQVKQYMFGADVVTDWKMGSSIVFRGMWEGKPFEDKGTILEIDPPRVLRSTYFSPLSGKPDLPENYAEVAYVLAADRGTTTLTVTQSNLAEEGDKAQAEGNWAMTLETMKAMIEA